METILELQNLVTKLDTANQQALLQIVRAMLPPMTGFERSYSKETLAAMEEARAIAQDPSVKGYRSVTALRYALESELDGD